MMTIFQVQGVVLGLAFAACASSPPLQNLGATEAAIGGAANVGGQGDPQASLYLKLSQEALAQAKVLAQDGKTARAERLLLRSQADAELAMALARQSKEHQEAQKATEQVEQLRSQGK